MAVYINPVAVAWNVYADIHNANARQHNELLAFFRKFVVEKYNESPDSALSYFESIEHMTGKEYIRAFKPEKTTVKTANLFLGVVREFLTYLRSEITRK